MSTIAAVTKDGMAAIACDSMSKWGHAKEPAAYVVNHEKIIRVGSTYLAFSGATSAKVVAADYFSKANAKADFSSVGAIFRTWLSFHSALKSRYFLLDDVDEQAAFESSQMDVLVANEYGIFGISANRAVQQFSQFYAYGGGYQYAIGAMAARYRDTSLSAQDLARLGVEIASEFNDETATPVYSYEVRLAPQARSAATLHVSRKKSVRRK